jgi:hypothetical protein
MDAEDYEIHDGDSNDLQSIKTELKAAMSRPEPLSMQEKLRIHVLKFQLKVYHVVDNVFKTERSNPKFHLVESKSLSFKLSIMGLGELDRVPEIGQPRLIQHSMRNFSFSSLELGVMFYFDIDKQYTALEHLKCSLHAYFYPTMAQMRSFRGIDAKLPPAMERMKHMAYFVNHNFNIIAELDDTGGYIRVEFYYIVIDPVARSEEYALLLLWANDNPPKIN